MNPQSKARIHILRVLPLAVLGISLPSTAFSMVSLGISGANSQKHYDLKSHGSQSGTLSISFAFGNHISLGVAGTKMFRYSEGPQYYETKTSRGYIYTRQENDIKSIEGFATIVLYNGLVSPFLFGGFANVYNTVYQYYGENLEIARSPVDVPTNATPTYGFGLSFRLSADFSLKVKQKYTKIESKELNGLEEEVDIDFIESESKLELSYHL